MNEDALRKLISLLKLPDRKPRPATFVLPADGVVDITSYPTCIVKNTNKAGDSSMGHWVAFFVISKDRYETFDSYGLPLSRYPDIVPPPGKCVAENCHTLQASDSYLCGYYCAWFLWHRSQGHIYRTFLRNFSDNLNKNDLRVNINLKIACGYTWFSGYALCPPGKQLCGKRDDFCQWKEPVNKLGRRAIL